MPLRGFKCCRDHQNKPFQTCIDTCREGGCLYPLHLLVRIPRKLSSREGIPHDFSATALTMCPRRFALEERHDFWEHPQDFIARDRGDAHHQWIDDSGPFAGVDTETRLFKTYHLPDGTPFVLSGKPDWVDHTRRELGDHKTTGWMPKAPYDSHEAQLNVYADLLEGGWEPDSGVGFWEPMERLWVEYFDGRAYQKFDVRVWSPEERLAFILERGAVLMDTRQIPAYLPPKLPDWPKAMLCKYCPVRETCEEAA